MPVASDIASNNADKAFFKEEIGKIMDSLYGSAMRLTRDPDDAQDLVAETVTKAWGAIASLEDHDLFKPWIFRILNNTFISLYRKKKSMPDMEPYVEEGEDDEPFSLFEKLHQPFLLWWGNPEQEYLSKILREDIVAAIEALPDAFKTAIIMVDVEGLSYEEVADCLDVPIGTVRSRIKRGRGYLQKTLWEQASEAGFETTRTTVGEST